ncbi:hypothetical protein ACEWY4_000544 [Coilia grayii]|uniref:Transmembrane protein 81 n=1 Tax=Coilia grayii TaxID=363190 RepID=A0ABD1KWY3_9TELE
MAPLPSTLCKTNPETCVKSSGARLNIWWWALWVVLLSGRLCQAATPKDKDIITLRQTSQDSVGVQHSSPCSTTCGLGLRVQEVCPLSGGQCYQRQVKCLDTWQCGMKTLTVPTGGRVELDCLGEVMGAMGSFAFMVSWRFARGIVTTDDFLFSRLAVPQLARLTLEPLQEKHAGTYRCDVLDKNYRQLKRVYYGLKVLPPELLRLDFNSALEKWDQVLISTNGSQTSVLSSSGVKDPLLISLTVTAATAALLLLLYLWDVYRRRPEGSSVRLRPPKQKYSPLENPHLKGVEEQISQGPLSIIQDYLTRRGVTHTMIIPETENNTLQQSVM